VRGKWYTLNNLELYWIQLIQCSRHESEDIFGFRYFFMDSFLVYMMHPQCLSVMDSAVLAHHKTNYLINPISLVVM
jgi:hypothetical protein